ncbi:hypothetical protein TNCV_1380731 [Trichonephila clavipes]|nr:hypothetical protein TNCV_1380731 [Trichonephila clavipes]
MAFGGSLPQINLGVQGVTQGGHHTVLLLLPVNMQFEIPWLLENMHWYNILSLKLSGSSSYLAESRTKRGPVPGLMPEDVPTT